MRTLLLVRHAKAKSGGEEVSDHERPLKKRGKRDAARIGWLLVEQDLMPQLVISSTAKRAHGTAKRIAHACNYMGEIVLLDLLYHGGPTGYIHVLQRVDDRYHRVMVVGHNPDIELLLEVLTGESEAFRPGAVASIELPIDAWVDIQEYVEGELVGLWGPEQLKELAEPEYGHTTAAQGIVRDAFEDEASADDAVEDDAFADEGRAFADAAFEDDAFAHDAFAGEGGAIKEEWPVSDTDRYGGLPSNSAN
jgi:phosphohistidine phosphatase